MPQYLFNKTHLLELIEKSPEDTNVIGIYIHSLEKGKKLPRIEAKALKLDTATGNHTTFESTIAVGTPSCPNPPGCSGEIITTLNIESMA